MSPKAQLLMNPRVNETNRGKRVECQCESLLVNFVQPQTLPQMITLRYFTELVAQSGLATGADIIISMLYY